MRSTMGSAALLAVFLVFKEVTSLTISRTQVQYRDLETRAFVNDFSCKSAEGKNPVILLHGLGTAFYEGILLENWLQDKGFCTFSLTYGAYSLFPFVGGLRPVQDSSRQIAAFIREVKAKTNSDKVDIYGHSEGAFQSIYTTKFQNISDSIGRVIAVSPPTHGTTFASLYKLAELTGVDGIAKAALGAFGCKACAELVTGGSAVQMLTDGPIAQPGVQYTVMATRLDLIITPPTTSFIDEPGVDNIWIQDYCPMDPVGHMGGAFDLNVWNLILNALEDEPGREFECTVGIPAK